MFNARSIAISKLAVLDSASFTVSVYKLLSNRVFGTCLQPVYVHNPIHGIFVDLFDWSFNLNHCIVIVECNFRSFASSKMCFNHQFLIEIEKRNTRLLDILNRCRLLILGNDMKRRCSALFLCPKLMFLCFNLDK